MPAPPPQLGFVTTEAVCLVFDRFAEYCDLRRAGLVKKLAADNSQRLASTASISELVDMRAQTREILGEMVIGKKTRPIGAAVRTDVYDVYEVAAQRLGTDLVYVAKTVILHGFATDMQNEHFVFEKP